MIALALALIGIAVSALARRPLVAGLGAGLAGAVLRLYHLGGPSLWLDEYITAWVVEPSSLASALARVHQALPGTPVYYVAAWGAVRLWGAGEAALRLPSAVAGLAAIGLAYGLGRDIAGKRPEGGLAAALLVALARPPVVAALDARPFSLAIALALASTWALVRLLWESKTPRAAVAYGAASAMLVYVNWLMAVYLLVQAVTVAVVLVRRRAQSAELARIGLAFGLALTLLLPALPKLLYDLHHAARYDWTRAGHPAVWRALLDPALLIGVACGFFARPAERARLLFALLLAPPVLLWVARPTFLIERYLCYAIAPAAALCALAAASAAPRARKLALALFSLGLLAQFAPSLIALGTAKNFRTEERWREAVAALDARAHTSDLVALRSGLVEEDAAWRGDRAVADLVRAPLGNRPYGVRSLTFTFDPEVRGALAGARFVLARDDDGYVDRLLVGASVAREERFGIIRLVELR
ncbi:MAG TPA: glycosyltransferase family 39 protein [Polyangia bacterium]|nr:glycosyltransferase family 39 protein [Polyangia bacterium]